MDNINIIKDSLRINGSRYVNSKLIDENSYKITFTYKNRNYSLNINKLHKFIMLDICSSIYGMEINNDTLYLIEYIKQMISYTAFEYYNVFLLSLKKEIEDDKIHSVLQIITEIDSFDAIIDSEIVEDAIEKEDYKVIEYNFGLNTFDKRLFDENIFEDFNEKVTTFCEEDLYLIYATLISYFYKLINDLWKSDKIDPYIIDDMLCIICKEVESRYDDHNAWFDEWSKYFDYENIEKYLNDRNKGKEKKIIL